jgi:hypothetical protein
MDLWVHALVGFRSRLPMKLVGHVWIRGPFVASNIVRHVLRMAGNEAAENQRFANRRNEWFPQTGQPISLRASMVGGTSSVPSRQRRLHCVHAYNRARGFTSAV